MKTIPNYFLGIVNRKIPVYCNVTETVKQGKFIPLYTTKRRVKNHQEIILNPAKFFNFEPLYKYISEVFNLPENIHLTMQYAGGELCLTDSNKSSLPMFVRQTTCPYITCKQPVIIISEGFLTCPKCRKSFMPE